MEAVRNLKTNLKLQGSACGWCQAPLELGGDASVCTTCEKAHHASCWEGKGGCATEGCVNAPLKRLDAAVPGGRAAAAAPDLAPGMMRCPSCKATLPIGTQICAVCRTITTPDGLYHGPLTTAKAATKALTFGILGLFICGVIFGPLAISNANAAKREIASDPTVGGGGLATAGLVLGIIDLVAWVIIILARVGAQ